MMRSLWKRLASFRRPSGPALAEPPGVGDPAPERPRLGAGEPRVVLFLRHTGCAFGEHMLQELRETAQATPDVEFVAVTHGDPEAATEWCEDLGLDRVAVHNPDTVSAVTRAPPEPRALVGEPTTAVRPVESRGTEADTDERDRQRIRTDGG